MAQYDPQRSHSRHRKADDEGPAPVDALLGPPAGSPVGAAAHAPNGSSVPDPAAGGAATGAPTWIDPRPDAGGPDHAMSGLRRPAIVVGVVLGAVIVVWALIRRRRAALRR
jgi:hypothetical protein